MVVTGGTVVVVPDGFVVVVGVVWAHEVLISTTVINKTKRNHKLFFLNFSPLIYPAVDVP